MATTVLEAQLPGDIVDAIMRRAHVSLLKEGVHATLDTAWLRFRTRRTLHFSDKLQDVYCDLAFYDYHGYPVPAAVLRELYEARYALACYEEPVMSDHATCVRRVGAWSAKEDAAFGVDATIPALIPDEESEVEDVDSVS